MNTTLFTEGRASFVQQPFEVVERKHSLIFSIDLSRCRQPCWRSQGAGELIISKRISKSNITLHCLRVVDPAVLCHQFQTNMMCLIIHSPYIICPQVRVHLRTFSAFCERVAVNYVDDLGGWGFVTGKHFCEWSYVNILLKIAFMRIKALLAS